jgi:hypothetical protein
MVKVLFVILGWLFFIKHIKARPKDQTGFYPEPNIFISLIFFLLSFLYHRF